MSIGAQTTDKVPGIGKLLAWLSILIGALTVLTPVLPIVPTAGNYSFLGLCYLVLLGLLSTVAGVHALRASSRAFYVLWYVYALQIFSYTSDSFSFDLMGPYSVTFGFGNYQPPEFIKINLLAIAACFVALYSARVLRAAGEPALAEAG